MEDHLQNKERLAEEWAQLQNYEADPCSTTHAQKQNNARKNRYGDALPCTHDVTVYTTPQMTSFFVVSVDHSRVVLSTTMNFANSDYINASCIVSVT